MVEWVGIAVVVALVPVSLALTRLMIAAGPRCGLIDRPGGRRIHERPTPRCGGLAIYATLMLGIAGLLLARLDLGAALDPVWLGYFAVGATLLVAIGVVDDRWGLSAWLKLGGHVLVALVMFSGNPEGMGKLMGVEVPWWVDMAVHVAWVVALINAFNLIDGMDGLCGGLGMIASAVLGGLALVGKNPESAWLFAAMVAALAGFLRYNFHPARIFLGDAGSMLIGFFIATAGAAAVGRQVTVSGLLLPLLVGGVPLIDVALAVWRRAARRLAVSKPGQAGLRLFDADRDHLHHRILGWGFSQRQAAWLIYGFAIVLALLGLIPLLGGVRLLAISVVGLIVVVLVGMRYVAPVEFMASGEGLRAMVRRPRPSGLVAFVYFSYDTLALSAAALGAGWVVAKMLAVEFSLGVWAAPAVSFVACGVLGLRCARAHSRCWTRSSVHDFSETVLWLVSGFVLSFGLLGFGSADFSFRLLGFHLIGGAVATGLVIVPRSIGFFLQEGVIDTMHRKRRLKGKQAARTTLIYGAGDLGELFVCHLRLSQPSQWRSDHFIGFVDDSAWLKGRRLRGFPVYGGIERLGWLVRRFGVNSVLVTASQLSGDREEHLMRLAEEHGLEVRQWRPELNPQTLSGAERRWPGLARPQAQATAGDDPGAAVAPSAG